MTSSPGLQLAGDVLRPDDPEAVEATGFLVAGAYDTVGQNQISQAMKAVVRSDELEDIIGTVSQTFLGLTINCARCHDHKFDPVRQVEYYQIASALSGVRHGERDLSEVDPETVALEKQIEALLARVAAIEAPVRARIVAQRKKALRAGPDALGGMGLRPRARRPDRLAQGRPSGERDRDAGRLARSMARRATRFRHRCRASSKPRRSRSGCGSTISNNAAVVRSASRRMTEASSTRSSSASRKPASGSAGSEFFRRYSQRRGHDGKGGGESRGPRGDHLRRRRHDPRFSRRPALRRRRTSRPARSTFPAGEAQVVFGLRHAPAGGNRMLAGTIVRARVYDRALDEAEVAASAATFGDYVDPGAITAALTPECRAERDAAHGKGRDASVIARRPDTQGIRRVAARGGRDARGNAGQPQPAR